MRDNADAAFRPLSFDVAVHAAFRISEAATLAQVAAERVAVWAKTREPPYTALNEHSMQELQAAIPIMKVAVKMASTTLYNDLRLVQPREDLWYPPATQKTGDRGQDEDEDNISIILDRFWWISSYEGDVVQIMAAQAVLDLHKATATGRDSWRKETQQLVKEMKLAQSFMKTALDDSSRGMKKATSARIVGAIKHAAGAVKQLTALAESTASAVFFHRFWQWGAWITGPKTISPSEAAAYTLAKLEAKETLARTKKAAAQAVAAAEAVEDYKHEV
ncbi:hypothetical protein SCUCBS95973_009466 [Sporothrix curviconia]|uniref:Uncharacterized protein n=1 Tax=Sporothrix curviconia TaxID=1260050 RepID=A0ABP0CXM9_9PEZI